MNDGQPILTIGILKESIATGLFNQNLARFAECNDIKLDCVDLSLQLDGLGNERAKLKLMRNMPDRATVDQTVIVDLFDKYDEMLKEAALFE